MGDGKAHVPTKHDKAKSPALREDYFDPFVTFRREMDRMFDHFFGGFPGRAGNGSGAIAPAVDLEETEKGIGGYGGAAWCQRQGYRSKLPFAFAHPDP